MENKKVNKLILGTANFGMQYGIANKKKLDENTCFDILATAFANNLWGVDTATAYGNAEQIIGNYRASHSSSFRIMTKGCFDYAESCSDVEQQIEVSLKNLNTNIIDVFLVHSYEAFIRKQDLIVPVFSKLKREGVIKRFGVSIYHPHEALSLTTLDVAQNGFVIEVPFSVFDQRFCEPVLLKTLGKRHCTLYGRSIFLQGLIFMKLQNLIEHFDLAKFFIAQYHALADSYDSDRSRFALAFAFCQDWLDGIVLGVDSKAQLFSHIKFLETCSIADFKPFLPAALKLKIEDERIILPYNWPHA